jgi:transcriptional regulator with XRE-family HTH domain
MRCPDKAEGKALTRSTAAAAADRFIGMRIRECRTTFGLSQRQLGERIGVTCQQAFKYERGINSVSAGRLYVIARELSTPLEYFFEGLEKDESQLPPRQRLLFEVMRNFGDVQNEKYLEVVQKLTRALVD